MFLILYDEAEEDVNLITVFGELVLHPLCGHYEERRRVKPAEVSYSHRGTPGPSKTRKAR